MTKELRQISKAMAAVLSDPKASRLERIEAARVAASVAGVLIPSPLDVAVPTKLGAQLQVARRVITEKLFEQRRKKAERNRKQYIRRRIGDLEGSGGNPELLAEFRNELKTLAVGQNSPQDAPVALQVPKLTPEEREAEKAFMAAAAERARQWLDTDKESN
ncbi:MAG TPA: hypothetical protein VHZ09_19350 [Acidobacteriaceae bacterium]|jgi:hypothetical protein|nr:hypothetical protein [Acidobacteriaceae bacterium]